MNKIISKVDYTLLTPSATEDEILKLCEKAIKFGVKSVCVRPNMVSIAKEALEKSNVLVCTVISFPHGTDTTDKKLKETKKAISDGADECDMVLNYPELINFHVKQKSDLHKSYFYVYDNLVNDISTLVKKCHSKLNKNKEPITLKVIVESSLLSLEETEVATLICIDSGADFIKTSTGFASNGIGAELNKVERMNIVIKKDGSNMKIKASGGLKTLDDLEKFDPLVDRFGVGFSAIDKIFDSAEKIENNEY